MIAYRGNYGDYLRQREERYERQLAAYKNQQKEITALQEFADRFRSVASKASQAMGKLILTGLSVLLRPHHNALTRPITLLAELLKRKTAV